MVRKRPGKKKKIQKEKQRKSPTHGVIETQAKAEKKAESG